MADTTAFHPPDGFDLRSTIGFARDFVPQPVDPTPADQPPQLTFATCVGSEWTPAQITVRQDGDGLHLHSVGVSGPTAASVATRVLSLDLDMTGLDEVARDDPVASEAIEANTGLRPPLFWSPYEAAMWAVLSQRSNMAQATRVKRRLTDEHGHRVGASVSFPAPETVLGIETFPGVSTRKVHRLHAVAEAALAGTLDPARLRGVDVDAALAELEAVDGIGPFSSGLILVRGAGSPDVFPTAEKRLHALMRDRYHRPDASIEELATIAQAWKPYRSVVSFYLRNGADI